VWTKKGENVSVVFIAVIIGEIFMKLGRAPHTMMIFGFFIEISGVKLFMKDKQ
jgi:hypothetical protein